ncbi:hypothetical protein DdX_14174 [Ditylenchus destructor]|uniref:Uncharacterized protein n=1 Tax=Ditylenchus destructor TaxID=166010 RepID=A0AAD4MTW0_9BILA|nr:hypothetical protein DdX_14174 [Ditylenchus destructor]
MTKAKILNFKQSQAKSLELVNTIIIQLCTFIGHQDKGNFGNAISELCSRPFLYALERIFCDIAASKKLSTNLENRIQDRTDFSAQEQLLALLETGVRD